MHFILIVGTIAIAALLRLAPSQFTGDWTTRWHNALFRFLLPPSLLLIAAFAIACMGPQGQMIGVQTDSISYCLVLGWFIVALLYGGQLALKGWQSSRDLHRYPNIQLNAAPTLQTRPKPLSARLLEDSRLFSAQIGFWQPELVITQGLLQTLSSEHLEAVLAHEQAHCHYRDTFWFFWLGWLRRLTVWLPNTEALWQELLVLRELRADRWAAQRVDSLLLAEALLQVVSTPALEWETACAAFSRPVSANRLQERIDALLDDARSPRKMPWWTWSWGVLALVPLVTLPFHS
ncbi:M56 family metallopeptidase [Lusitaniella coriacea]|uniref:M56 family metallopeptidase n=1 Tax=Lusitaniella coriacea TaxID=1983105 RepID=UPI003CFAADA9